MATSFFLASVVKLKKNIIWNIDFQGRQAFLNCNIGRLYVCIVVKSMKPLSHKYYVCMFTLKKKCESARGYNKDNR